MGRKYLFTLLLSTLLFACSAPQPHASATPLHPPTSTITATATRIPRWPTWTITTTPLPSSTPTGTNTPGPSPTPTLIPTLTTHKFAPEDILISYNDWNGDGGFTPDRAPIKFVLYGNGHLVIAQGDSKPPLEKYLERQEVCQLLNTVEQIGFLGFKPDDLPPADGAASTTIKVNSWDNGHLQSLSLNWAIQCQSQSDDPNDNCHQIDFYPEISQPAQDVYSLLNSYQPEGMTEYESDGLLVWFAEPNSIAQDFEWTLVNPSLESLYRERRCSYEKVPILLDEHFYQTFAENQIFSYRGFAYLEKNLRLSILYRPLWPYENLNDNCSASGTHGVYGPEIPDLPESIACTPEDGVIQLP